VPHNSSAATIAGMKNLNCILLIFTVLMAEAIYADVLVMPGDTLLVSDDETNVIYRISYTK